MLEPRLPDLFEAVVLEPRTTGHCRLGQYCVLLRKFLDELGFSETPILGVSNQEGFTNIPVPKSVLIKLFALTYKGVFCNDLLLDALSQQDPMKKKKEQPKENIRF